MLSTTLFLPAAFAAMTLQDVEKQWDQVVAVRIRASDLGKSEFKAARKFANCMTLPRFPTESEFEDVERKCSNALPKYIGAALSVSLNEIRHIVRQNPGSEINLTLSRKSDD